MSKPIIIIDDDNDDHEFIKEAFLENKVKNEIVFFTKAMDAFVYLKKEDVFPFMIISDINMPVLNGLELRDKIYEDPLLRIKCIPYIFLTTGRASNYVWEAYANNAQGYFIKPITVTEWKELVFKIVQYWDSSLKPV